MNRFQADHRNSEVLFSLLDSLGQSDQLIMFLCCETLVQYWHFLGASEPRPADRELIQVAARASVGNFMGNEEIFWNIDFSATRAEHTRKHFAKGLRGLSSEGFLFLMRFSSQYCANRTARVSAAFATGFLHRVTHEKDVQDAVGLSDIDVTLIALCFESVDSDIADIYEMRDSWLSSELVWDTRIRRMTPDVPECVFLNFSEAYDAGIYLPTFASNVRLMMNEIDVKDFLLRLSNALKKAFPITADLKVPLMLLPESY